MTIEDRKEKIKELQIKNRRKKLENDIKSKINEITIEGFMGIEDTIKISRNIYKKIDLISNKTPIPKQLKYSKQYLLSLENQFKALNDKTMLLFHQQDRETGLLKIPLHDFFIDIDTLLDVVGFAKDYRDLLFVDEGLSLGICIERFEYENSFIVWGGN
ncbi:group-specific protein [Paenibacillus algicola]|uniref:Group-specific protein n=1 Tax=Paenibacillus algicola TaxID=2565926 RepID=A0A4P8XH16_9BACL|nr:hypothetical protein [Paenibacillus algicola]QCT01635.1 group-specific protein [Paenibacillus algicola]